MKFKQSPVVFNEEEHSYMLGEKRLFGITGLIHSVLGLGVYPEVNDYVKDFLIPKAGSRGTAVHHAIQTFDALGIRQSIQTVRTRYGCRKRQNLSYVEEKWDVSFELDAYIRNRMGFRPLANELTVSDNEKFASQIDNVWQNIETLGIWLVDTKTNNTDLYPHCGYYVADYFSSGEEALKEYLSWQLSVYAEFFEAENPGIKVEGLACNWLRKDRADFWEIERKPAELVWELLKTEYIVTDNGPIFFHHDPSVFGIRSSLPEKKKEQTPIIAADVVDYFSSLLKRYKETEARLEEAKTALKAAMQHHDVKQYDFGAFSATIGADSMTTTFDTKRFKQDHPEMYEKYASKKSKKGSFTIKLKDND